MDDRGSERRRPFGDVPAPDGRVPARRARDAASSGPDDAADGNATRPASRGRPGAAPRRPADQADRRRTIVQIAPSARRVVEEWLDGAAAPLARVLDRLADDERAAFLKALGSFEA